MTSAVAVSVLVLVASGAPAQKKSDPVEHALGRKAMSTIREATRAEIVLLAHDERGLPIDAPAGSDAIGRYVAATPPKALAPADLARLQRMLLDAQGYPPPPVCPAGSGCGAGKACTFEPAVAIRLQAPSRSHQARSVDLAVCLACDEVEVGRGQVPGDAGGELAPIDPMHRSMLAFLRGIFPDDPGLERVSAQP